MRARTSFLGKLALASLAFGNASLATGTAVPAINWVNSSSQNAVAVLNGGQPFVTSFKGINDVTISLAGGVEPLLTDDFPVAGNNPAYLTNFVGNSATGTGNGSSGGVTFLNTTNGTNSTILQFDFAQPLRQSDRMIVGDVDNDEVYRIQAFTKVGQAFEPVSLTGWTEQAFTGQTGIPPNSSWPTWDPVAGTLTSSGIRLNEPMNILTPDQSIDRIIFTQVAGNEGNGDIQFMTVPEPSALMLFGSGMMAALTLRRFRRRS